MKNLANTIYLTAINYDTYYYIFVNIKVNK